MNFICQLSLAALILLFSMNAKAAMVILAKGQSAIISLKGLELPYKGMTLYGVRNKLVVSKLRITKIIGDNEKALVKVLKGEAIVRDEIFKNSQDYDEIYGEKIDFGEFLTFEINTIKGPVEIKGKYGIGLSMGVGNNAQGFNTFYNAEFIRFVDENRYYTLAYSNQSFDYKLGSISLGAQSTFEETISLSTHNVTLSHAWIKNRWLYEAMIGLGFGSQDSSLSTNGASSVDFFWSYYSYSIGGQIGYVWRLFDKLIFVKGFYTYSGYSTVETTLNKTSVSGLVEESLALSTFGLRAGILFTW